MGRQAVVMRVMIKGGVWKNTEDEILKAAVRPLTLPPPRMRARSAHHGSRGRVGGVACGRRVHGECGDGDQAVEPARGRERVASTQP